MKNTPLGKQYFASDEQKAHEQGLRRRQLDEKKLKRYEQGSQGSQSASLLRRGMKYREMK